MRTAEIGTGAVCDLVGREQEVRLDDGTLAMDPLRLDGVESRAFDWQVAGIHYAPHTTAVAIVGLWLWLWPSSLRE
jgi:hypothetical protein